MAQFVIDVLNPSVPLPEGHKMYLRAGFIYTHQSVGAGTIEIKGSNDGVSFVSLVTLTENTAETLMHSFRYLQINTTGAAQYLLCRGY